MGNLMSGVLCCFCNEDIKSTNIDPCNLNILMNWDKSPAQQRDQDFWCHLECLREKLHENIKKHLVLQLLSVDDEN
jgi:hypothetical protein